MRKVLKYPVMALLALVTAAATSTVVAAPAHAYGDGLWRWVSFNTGNCGAVGGYDFSVGSSGDYCVAGGIKFRKDSGGVGLMATFTPDYCCGGNTEFRVEWHPHGEHLKICDLSNDGDTIYARLRYKSYNWYWKNLVGTPGSSASVECADANYSFVEGSEIRVYLYDNKSMSDFMAGFYNLRG